MTSSKGSFWAAFKRLDVYGSRTQLNFRGEKVYRTGIGAFCSIFTFILVIAYAGIGMDRWVNHKNTDFVSNTILKDMSEELQLNATENRYQFGFAWLDIRSWQVVRHDPRIAIPQIRSVQLDFVPFLKFTKTPLPLSFCREDQFSMLNNENKFATRNISDFMCPDLTDHAFKGTFQDEKHIYMHFEVLSCEKELLNQLPGYEDAECAPLRQLQMFHATHILVGILTNSYFDTNDLDDPVKTMDEYIFNHQVDIAENKMVEVMLNHNEATLNDQMVQVSDDLEQRTRSWISLEEVRDFNIRSINPTAYFQAQFRLNNRVRMYERRIYSLFDLMGDVGGFVEALYVLSFVSVSMFAQKMFKAAQIRDIFHVRTETNKTDLLRLHSKLPASKSRSLKGEERIRSRVNGKIGIEPGQAEPDGFEPATPVQGQNLLFNQPQYASQSVLSEATAPVNQLDLHTASRTAAPTPNVLDFREARPTNKRFDSILSDEAVSPKASNHVINFKTMTPKLESLPPTSRNLTEAASNATNFLGSEFNLTSQIVAKAENSVLKPLKRGSSLVSWGSERDKRAQERLEANILCREGHKLSKIEVEQVLRKQNLQKYKKLQFTKRQALLDSCWSWLIGRSCFRNGFFSRRREKNHILYKLGIKRLDQALDVRALVSAHQNMFNLTKLMLDRRERQLFRFQRRNVLEFGGTESDTTNSEAELVKIGKGQGSKKFLDLMTGYTPKSLFEKKLVLGIMHRRNHKDVELDKEMLERFAHRQATMPTSPRLSLDGQPLRGTTSSRNENMYAKIRLDSIASSPQNLANQLPPNMREQIQERLKTGILEINHSSLEDTEEMKAETMRNDQNTLKLDVLPDKMPKLSAKDMPQRNGSELGRPDDLGMAKHMVRSVTLRERKPDIGALEVETDYADYLQAPLQGSRNNLHCPKKVYENYIQSQESLKDKVTQKSLRQQAQEPLSKETDATFDKICKIYSEEVHNDQSETNQR